MMDPQVEVKIEPEDSDDLRERADDDFDSETQAENLSWEVVDEWNTFPTTQPIITDVRSLKNVPDCTQQEDADPEHTAQTAAQQPKPVYIVLPTEDGFVCLNAPQTTSLPSATATTGANVVASTNVAAAATGLAVNAPLTLDSSTALKQAAECVASSVTDTGAIAPVSVTGDTPQATSAGSSHHSSITQPGEHQSKQPRMILPAAGSLGQLIVQKKDGEDQQMITVTQSQDQESFVQAQYPSLSKLLISLAAKAQSKDTMRSTTSKIASQVSLSTALKKGKFVSVIPQSSFPEGQLSKTKSNVNKSVTLDDRTAMIMNSEAMKPTLESEDGKPAGLWTRLRQLISPTKFLEVEGRAENLVIARVCIRALSALMLERLNKESVSLGKGTKKPPAHSMRLGFIVSADVEKFGDGAQPQLDEESSAGKKGAADTGAVSFQILEKDASACHLSEGVMLGTCYYHPSFAQDKEEETLWRAVYRNGKLIHSLSHLGLVRFVGANIFTFERQGQKFMSLGELYYRSLLPRSIAEFRTIVDFLDEVPESIPWSELAHANTKEATFLNQFIGKHTMVYLLITPYALLAIYERLGEMHGVEKWHKYSQGLFYQQRLGHHCFWSLQVTPPTGHRVPQGVPGAVPHEGQVAVKKLYSVVSMGDPTVTCVQMADGGAGTSLEAKEVSGSLQWALLHLIQSSPFDFQDRVKLFCDCPLDLQADPQCAQPLTFNEVLLTHITEMKFLEFENLHCWKREMSLYVSLLELRWWGLLPSASNQLVSDMLRWKSATSQNKEILQMLRAETVFLTLFGFASKDVLEGNYFRPDEDVDVDSNEPGASELREELFAHKSEKMMLLNLSFLMKIYDHLAAVDPKWQEHAQGVFYVKHWLHDCPKELENLEKVCSASSSVDQEMSSAAEEEDVSTIETSSLQTFSAGWLVSTDTSQPAENDCKIQITEHSVQDNNKDNTEYNPRISEDCTEDEIQNNSEDGETGEFEDTGSPQFQVLDVRTLTQEEVEDMAENEDAGDFSEDAEELNVDQNFFTTPDTDSNAHQTVDEGGVSYNLDGNAEQKGANSSGDDPNSDSSIKDVDDISQDVKDYITQTIKQEVVEADQDAKGEMYASQDVQGEQKFSQVKIAAVNQTVQDKRKQEAGGKIILPAAQLFGIKRVSDNKLFVPTEPSTQQSGGRCGAKRVRVESPSIEQDVITIKEEPVDEVEESCDLPVTFAKEFTGQGFALEEVDAEKIKDEGIDFEAHMLEDSGADQERQVAARPSRLKATEEEALSFKEADFPRACTCKIEDSKNYPLQSFSIQQCYGPKGASRTHSLTTLSQVGQAIIHGNILFTFKSGPHLFFSVSQLLTRGVLSRSLTYRQLKGQGLAEWQRPANLYEQNLLGYHKIKMSSPTAPMLLRTMITAELLCSLSYKEGLTTRSVIKQSDIYLHQPGHICPNPFSLAHLTLKNSAKTVKDTDPISRLMTAWKNSSLLISKAQAIMQEEKPESDLRKEVESLVAVRHVEENPEQSVEEDETEGLVEPDHFVLQLKRYRKPDPVAEESPAPSKSTLYYVCSPEKKRNVVTSKVYNKQRNKRAEEEEEEDELDYGEVVLGSLIPDEFHSSDSATTTSRKLHRAKRAHAESHKLRKVSCAPASAGAHDTLCSDKASARITEDWVQSALQDGYSEYLFTHVIIMFGRLHVWGRNFCVMKVNGKLYLNWSQCAVKMFGFSTIRCLAEKLLIYVYRAPRPVLEHIAQSMPHYTVDNGYSNPWVCVNSLIAVYCLGMLESQNALMYPKTFSLLWRLYVETSLNKVQFTSFLLYPKQTEVKVKYL